MPSSPPPAMKAPNRHKIAVLDFGGQYAHLIANRIRRIGVYSEILSPDVSIKKLSGFKGIIFSGGPHSVYDKGAPGFNRKILDTNKPILGICYGHQLICHALGGKVEPGEVREFGKADLVFTTKSLINQGINRESGVWMSHGDTVRRLPSGFHAIGSTDDCEFAAVEHPVKRIYGFQFHPEVTHTAEGMIMLANFISTCGCEKQWNMKNYYMSINEEINKKTKGRNVFLLVSGGVDSVVAFSLLNKVLGEKRVLGLHIDNGLMRKNETSAVGKYLKANHFRNLRIVNATKTFLSNLKGIVEPEQKRRIIGDTFISVQKQALARLKLNPLKWMLGQGTIYPDTIESGGTRHAAIIKTHHNRVPIIEKMIKEGRVIEPLSELYKDEVRELGRELGLLPELIGRHPFPGPGLGVRILCGKGEESRLSSEDLHRVRALAKDEGFEAQELPIKSVGVQGDFRTYAQPLVIEGPEEWDRISSVSTDITNSVRSINRVVFLLGRKSVKEPQLFSATITRGRIKMLQEADDLTTGFLRAQGLYDKIWQMPVVLIPVGVGKNKESIVLRPVSSSEAMTADFFRIPFGKLKVLIKQILKIPGISAVYYDVTNKPPATIEWE